MTGIIYYIGGKVKVFDRKGREDIGEKYKEKKERWKPKRRDFII